MIQANIHEAKTQLSKLIEKALAGERVVIAKHNKPVVEIKSINHTQEVKNSRKKLLGLYKGKIKLTKKFFEPLPDDLLEAFNNPTIFPKNEGTS